jgi:hypothetical protein
MFFNYYFSYVLGQSQSTLNDQFISYGPHLEQGQVLGELSESEVHGSQLVNENDLNETGMLT